MKILLTGGSGFVGRNFIKTHSTKYQIHAIVRENSDIKDIENHCEIFRYDGKIANLKNYLNKIFANGGGD